jgi:hypothetical protein
MRRRVLTIGAAFLLLAALAGGGVAWATAGDDESVTGPQADRAAAAAVAHVGGGEALEVERDGGGAAWEVEVRRADGSIVEVVLDDNYHVVGSASDSEEGDDSEDGDESEDEDVGG